MSIPKRVRVLVALLVSAFVAGGCGSEPSEPSEAIGKTQGAATLVVQNDFEDGTNQGWIPRGPVTLTNTTEAAAEGTHSLKTTGRTAGFHGPSRNVLPQLLPGTTYQISVRVRLVAGTAPSQVLMTMQQTPTGGSNQFITVASNGSVTDAAWVTLTGNFSYNVSVSGLLLYVESPNATASFYIDSFSITELGANISHGWEDGSLQGWIPRGPVTLTNTTEAAAEGTRSLKTTGRTAGFHGPSLNLQGVLKKGFTYLVSVRVRLVTGTPSSLIRVSVQRTPVGASSQFDTVGQNSAVTDAAFVTITGLYTFATDNTGLLLYVESTNATASYYIDAFNIAEVAPPPGAPGNTAGAAANFETGTREGWFPRTGTEVLTVTTADKHAGEFSLLTTNRTSTFRGPAYDVTNVMFNGSRYRVSLWVKLAPGEPDTQLRVSLERRAGTLSTFHTVIGNTTITSGGWTRLLTTFNQTLANTSLTMYVESNAGLASFYIDDFDITFVPPAVAERDIPSVHETLADFFPVGAAIHAGDLTGEHAFLLTKHFNMIVSENDMKWASLQPTQGTFTFATADAQVAFARTNNMRVRGHTLVWHAQTPAWVFNDAAGAPLTPTPENKALLLGRMEAHIRAVMEHFGSDIYAWDVVNEVIDPGQPDGFRRSPWFNITGTEYIDRAFQVAHEMAPNAELYINDFSTTDTTKRQFLFNLISDLKSRGIPVEGIGHQMHNNVEFPSGQAIVDTVNLFDGLAIKQEVTELDVSIYSGSFPGPIVDYLDIPSSLLIQQGYRYRTFFNAFKQLQGKISSVTLWGQADDHTWLASATRTNAPLLFDQSLKKKHAYWGVVDPLQLPGADVVMSVSASPTVVAGQVQDCMMAVENVGDDDTQAFQPADDDLPAQNVRVLSSVPAGAAFQSLTAPPGWSCTTPPIGGSGPISCQAPSLAVNASEAFTLSTVPSSCSTPNGTVVVHSASATSTTADPNLAANNSASANSVVSNSPPVISMSGAASMTLECGTSFADPGASATDACEGPVEVTASGTVNVNAVGAYTIHYDANDSAGGDALTVSRLVNVVDTITPTMDMNDLMVLLPGVRITLNGQTITINGRSFTLTDQTLRVLGTKITFNGSSITIDNHTFSLDGQTVMLLLPLHQYQEFTTADFVAALGTDCDPGLDLGDVVIERVTSDEPEDAEGGSDGKTLNDMVIGADCRTVKLRSERNASGNGRVYTVTLRVRDASGNTTTRSVTVLVPKNHGLGQSVDDGAAYAVTASCQ